MLVVIVMGGIYGGIFTPTEAASVSAVYAFIAAVFIYRGLKLREVPRVLLSRQTRMMLLIITNAILFLFATSSRFTGVVAMGRRSRSPGCF
jgi:C4-dicarboxylate transporter DctM subunit